MNAKNMKLLLSKPQQQRSEIKNKPQEAIASNMSAMQKNDLLVILGSHYFGPHINTIFKNCFDKPTKYS